MLKCRYFVYVLFWIIDKSFKPHNKVLLMDKCHHPISIVPFFLSFLVSVFSFVCFFTFLEMIILICFFLLTVFWFLKCNVLSALIFHLSLCSVFCFCCISYHLFLLSSFVFDAIKPCSHWT